MKNVTGQVRKIMQKTWEQIPRSVKVSWIFFVAAALCLHYFVEKPSQKQARVLPANSSGVLAEAKKELPIYCVKTNENKVALSFDAAWGAEDTIQILDILDKYNVKVTFFMTGGWVIE